MPLKLQLISHLLPISTTHQLTDILAITEFWAISAVLFQAGLVMHIQSSLPGCYSTQLQILERLQLVQLSELVKNVTLHSVSQLVIIQFACLSLDEVAVGVYITKPLSVFLIHLYFNHNIQSCILYLSRLLFSSNSLNSANFTFAYKLKFLIYIK